MEFCVGYEFENIESQIEKVLALLRTNKLKDEDSKGVLSTVGIECGRIKKVFKQLALSAEEERQVRRFFHVHQESLITLINKLDDSSSTKAAVFLAALRNLLVDALDTFKKHFPQFFDYAVPIPDFLWQTFLSEMVESANALKQKFAATALDPELLDLMFETFKVPGVLSYQKVNYLAHLLRHLSALDISVNDPDLLRQDFCKVLIRCNYNTERVFQYYTRIVRKALVNCETLSDRIDLVSWFLKECNQEQCLHKISFDPQRPPIHIQLGDWLTQEVDYYKQKQQLLLSPGLLEEGPEKDFKLNFDLSVSQLAYLLKALV
jgi:hypothetical protein